MRSHAPSGESKKALSQQKWSLKKEPLQQKWSLKKEPLNSPLQRLGGTVGYHKKRYPNQNNKNRKRQSEPSAITRAQGAGPGSPDSLASGTSHGSPDPLASGKSTASPDPPWPRAQVPPRSTPLGLERQRRFARSPITEQGFQRTAPVPMM